MIPYDSFNGRVDAHFEYALALRDDDAADVFRRRLADRSWLESPSAWANRFAALVWRAGDRPSVQHVLDALAAALVDGPLDQSHRQVLVPLAKAVKPRQDRRIDLPTIGPATVMGAARAGLAGIVGEAGSLLVVDRQTVIQMADDLGLFVSGVAPP